VAEWSKALAWKVSNILKGVRGFESLPLRHTVNESMAARVCIFATTGHEPRQARKGAAVEALSRAPKPKLARAAS
jgi:hypothetical protein